MPVFILSLCVFILHMMYVIHKVFASHVCISKYIWRWSPHGFGECVLLGVLDHKHLVGSTETTDDAGLK